MQETPHALIAIGAVRQFNISQTVTYEKQRAYNPVYGVNNKEVRELRTSVQENIPWMIELFLTGGAMRFQTEGEQLAWGYLFQKAPPELMPRLVALVQLLAKHAPHARFNRGAIALRDGAGANVTYSGKPAFYDETAWLLWRARRPGA